jgi:hypothetical protein
VGTISTSSDGANEPENEKPCGVQGFRGSAPERIRTSDLRFRSGIREFRSTHGVEPKTRC